MLQVRSEKDKSHKLGTNTAEGGSIPDLELFPGFNPAQLFQKYLNYVPDEGTIEGKGGNGWSNDFPLWIQRMLSAHFNRFLNNFKAIGKK